MRVSSQQERQPPLDTPRTGLPEVENSSPALPFRNRNIKTFSIKGSFRDQNILRPPEFKILCLEGRVIYDSSLFASSGGTENTG